MTKPVRINLYCGPGSGKSTVAAWLFALLKKRGCRIEHVNEWIKTWAWAKHKLTKYDQLYVINKQLRREEQLLRYGVPIITDAALPLQLAYIRRDAGCFYDGLTAQVREFERDYPSVAVCLQRSVPYSSDGRYETEAAAQDMDESIFAEMRKHTPGKIITFDPRGADSDTVVDELRACLEI